MCLPEDDNQGQTQKKSTRECESALIELDGVNAASLMSYKITCGILGAPRKGSDWRAEHVARAPQSGPVDAHGAIILPICKPRKDSTLLSMFSLSFHALSSHWQTMQRQNVRKHCVTHLPTQLYSRAVQPSPASSQVLQIAPGNHLQSSLAVTNFRSYYRLSLLYQARLRITLLSWDHCEAEGSRRDCLGNGLPMKPGKHPTSTILSLNNCMLIVSYLQSYLE